MTFTQPQTTGKTPPARYMHSMDYYKDGNFLILVGGRNDKLAENIMGNLWILKLNN
jgi:hypothetical protein